MSTRTVPALAAFVLPLLLTGCPKPAPEAACDTSSLDAALARAEAAANPAERTKAVADAVAVACPDVPPPPSLATGDATPMCALEATDLRGVWDACTPEPLGPVDAFVWADGNPRLATVLLAWMTENGVDPAVAAHTAQVVRGRPLYTPPPSGAPTLPAGLTGPVPTAAATWVVTPELLQAPGSPGWSAGRFTDDGGAPGRKYAAWAVAGVAPATGVVAAVDTRVKVEELQRLVASLEAPLTLLGTDAKGAPASLVLVPHATEQTVKLAPDATLADLVAAAAGKAEVQLAVGGQRCRPGPDGMVCVAGTEQRASFWIDPAPATVADWDTCVRGGQCSGKKAGDGALVGLRFDDARKLCQFEGKRLPTEAELAAAPATGGAAWTWTTTNAKGEAPCELAQCRSQSHAVVWRNGARALESRSTSVADAGVRCATSHPWTTALPAHVVTNPRPARGMPEKTTPEQRKLASDFARDPIEDKGVCGGRDIKKGGAGLECRDPLSYVIPNENRDLVWRPYLENIGGSYIGVGSDQAYNFCAAMRCEWAWMMDYDPNVVRAHKVILAAIQKSDTPAAFAEYFAPTAAAGKSTEAVLREVYATDPELEKLVEFFYGYRPKMYEWYAWRLRPYEEDKKWGWLANPDQFAYIKAMVAEGRMIPVGGDMLGSKSMQNIGAAAKQLGTTIRVYYTSNAPTAWGGQLTPEYRANVRSLPMDEWSVVAETHYQGDRPGDNWRYTTIGGVVMQERLALPSYERAHELEWDRLSTPVVDFAVLGLYGP
jgi:hypothetical protein